MCKTNVSSTPNYSASSLHNYLILVHSTTGSHGGGRGEVATIAKIGWVGVGMVTGPSFCTKKFKNQAL
jgi:hypothetical protein